MAQTPQTLTRRQALLRLLLGSGAVGLRSLASGLPLSVLMAPEAARAAAAASTSCPSTQKAQFLILSQSSDGDPINGNVPGTYNVANATGNMQVAHPPATTMAPTNLTVGSTQTTAAAPWASLPASVLGRTVFFHHGTYTVVHGDQQQTQRLDGAISGNEMLVSLLASQLAGCLGTVQAEPICVGAGNNGGELLTYAGRTLPSIPPSTLAEVLTMPNGPLKDLSSIRDQTLDQMYTWFKTHGNASQSSFIDRWATSQTQLRSVSDALLGNLANIKDNQIGSQMSAAIALIQLKVSPVVSIHIPFGGDNHGDNALQNEANACVTGVANIGTLQTQLASANLSDSVSFLTLNVFGRTIATNSTSPNGRNHNANHHVAVMVGSGLAGGVVGGITPMGGDYGATGINSTSGASVVGGGDIPFTETFGAMGKTIGRACGISSTFLDSNITLGKPVTSALSAA